MKKNYLDAAKLSEELEKSQKNGNEPTEELCKAFRLMATRLLGDKRYRGYPKDMQEDMVSAALEKCVRNVKNFKAEYAKKCFSYYTRCAEHAFWETLSRHYKYINAKRAAARQYIEKMGMGRFYEETAGYEPEETGDKT